MSAPSVDPPDLGDLPPILTTKQLGQLMGKSTDQLANERYNGGGPAFVKYGAKVYYLRSDVIAFLSANRHDPAQDKR